MIKSRKTIFAVSGIAILVAGAVVAGVAWNNGLRDRFIPKRFGVVESGKICRSGRIHPAILEDTLKQHGIKTIINLTGADGLRKEEGEAARKLGIEIFNYKFIEGGLSPASDYAAVIMKISDSRKAGRPVLVHCNAGENRTGGVIAVYRMLVEGKSAEEAYAEMLRYGWKKDNMMISHLNENMKPISELLVSSKVIDRMPDPVPQLPVK
ncbi:MAG: dual specificity protein phosphatase family protein [Victivallales bacterium]